MEILRQHQLNIMLVLMGVCMILPLLTMSNTTLSRGRRHALFLIEVRAFLLLLFDRFAHLFRGDPSTLGYYMVRISNFALFAMIPAIHYTFSLYLTDLFFTDQQEKQKLPKRIRFVRILTMIGEGLVILSQFTGLYYTFDANNCYQRGEYFWISYIIPYLMLIVQLSVIFQYSQRIRPLLRTSLLLFEGIMIIASVIQVFAYGLSLINMSIIIGVALLYVFAHLDLNNALVEANRHEIEILQEEQKNMQLMLEQTTSAIATAIDAKDQYTHGHSKRVAEYSVKIAKLAGKDEKECSEIYFAALLHDVGKIGVPDTIITKEGRLTDEEFAAIKKHPSIGNQILSGISISPYLSIGANYHHERYDGRGYPEGLKGEDIPESARIIAVADAYDAMTSRRSYRDPLPQHIVREEIVKGLGTQFDPIFGGLMLHLIDQDEEYQMVERDELKELAGKDRLICGEYRDSISDGIRVTSVMTTIQFIAEQNADDLSIDHIPTLLLFDSLDGRVHADDKLREKMVYFEYGSIRLDGSYECTGARKMQFTCKEIRQLSEEERLASFAEGVQFQIDAVRYEDHMQIKILSRSRLIEFIIALPDSTRFSYIGLTGEHCIIRDVDIVRAGEEIGADVIPRIAEKISYIKDQPVGDIPSIQIDAWRSGATAGFPVRDGMTLSLHTMSLPTARLIWHCPFIVLFWAEDRQVNGAGYRELALIRLDGESWDSDDNVDNTTFCEKTEEFRTWDTWKAQNKEGRDCEVHFERHENTVIVTCSLGGIRIRNVTEVHDEVGEIYAALTGDQCALSDIRIH